MRLTLSFLFFFIVSNLLFSQQYDLKEGIYLRSFDFIHGKPFVPKDFTINDFFLVKSDNDSNFYKLAFYENSIKKKLKNTTIWGIYQNATLYLSARMFYDGAQNQFVIVREIGAYTYFRGKPILDLEQQETLKRSFDMFPYYGVIPYMVNGININVTNKGKDNFILNLEKGVLHLLNQQYIEFLLNDNPELLSQFQNEIDKSDLNVQLKYIRILNERSDFLKNFND